MKMLYNLAKYVSQETHGSANGIEVRPGLYILELGRRPCCGQIS